MAIENKNQSILSKKFKTREQKMKKHARHLSNVQHRAGLHSQKAATGSATEAASLQTKIDALSKGVHL